MEIVLIYRSGGLIYSRTVECLSLKGLDDVDLIEALGPVHKLLNGGMSEKDGGFHKHIQATVRPITTPVDRRFLAQFILASDKSIKYGNYVSGVVNEKPELVSEWLEDCEYCRQFTLELLDTHVYREWDDGLSEDDVIIKLDIPLVGTSGSPETFTTGSGKLLLDEAGLAFPSFDDTAYAYGIIPINANGCQATMHASTPTESGGNLTFTMFYGDTYTPAVDELMYVSIYILKEAKV